MPSVIHHFLPSAMDSSGIWNRRERIDCSTPEVSCCTSTMDHCSTILEYLASNDMLCSTNSENRNRALCPLHIVLHWKQQTQRRPVSTASPISVANEQGFSELGKPTSLQAKPQHGCETRRKTRRPELKTSDVLRRSQLASNLKD